MKYASLPGADCRVLDTVQSNMVPQGEEIQFYTTPLCYFWVLWYLGEVPIPLLADTNEVK